VSFLAVRPAGAEDARQDFTLLNQVQQKHGHHLGDFRLNGARPAARRWRDGDFGLADRSRSPL
jgi:hypothetical protein